MNMAVHVSTTWLGDMRFNKLMQFIMQTALISFICLNPSRSLSQDLKKEIVFSSPFKLAGYDFTDNGNFYLLHNKKDIKTKQKKYYLTVYSAKDFEETLSYVPKNKIKIRSISPDGKSLLYSTSKSKSKFNILDEQGHTKTLKDSKIEGNLYREYSKRNLLSDFDLRVDFTEFMLNKSYYVIAPKIKDSPNLSLLERSFDLKTPKYSKFSFPNYETDRKKLLWSLNTTSSDQLVFVAKDLSKDGKVDNYFVSIYDEKFNIQHSTSLKVEFLKDYFSYSNDGKGTSWYHYAYDTKDSTAKNVDALSGATGNLLFDKEENVFYTYGLYSVKQKPYRIIKPDGFYIYKFDWKGKLLWNKKHSISEYKNFSKKQKGFHYIVKLNKTGNKLGISLRPEDGKNIYLASLDENTGDIIKKSISAYSYSRNGYNGISKNTFWSPYNLKNDYSSKLNFDFETIEALFFNSKFSNYLKSLKDQKFSFTSKIIDSGVIVIQSENKTDKFSLMKFSF